MYISEKKKSTAAEAAAHADDFMLTHNRGRVDFPASGNVSPWNKPARVGFLSNQRGEQVCEYVDFCHYCHEKVGALGG